MGASAPTSTRLHDPFCCGCAVIAFGVFATEIGQMSSALPNHFEQTAPRVFVVFVKLEMLCQLVDAGSQQRNLHFRRAGIIGCTAILVNNSFFLALTQWHHNLLTLSTGGAYAPPEDTALFYHDSTAYARLWFPQLNVE